MSVFKSGLDLSIVCSEVWSELIKRKGEEVL